MLVDTTASPFMVTNIFPSSVSTDSITETKNLKSSVLFESTHKNSSSSEVYQFSPTCTNDFQYHDTLSYVHSSCQHCMIPTPHLTTGQSQDALHNPTAEVAFLDPMHEQGLKSFASISGVDGVLGANTSAKSVLLL